MLIRKMTLILCFMSVYSISQAGAVSIRHVELQRGPADWTVNVTLEHADSGWEHYADAWRVVDSKGNVLATRTLWHPHVDEQPFTRSMSGIKIPPKTTKVYVEAHDKVHGWSKDRVLVELGKASGKRYSIK